MKTKCVNLEVFRKTTKIYELNFTQDGNSKDITGWTIYFTVKEKKLDTDNNAKIKYDITTPQDATNGKTLIELTQSDTDRTGNYYYSIDYKDNEGNVGVLFYGRILFLEKVAQRV